MSLYENVFIARQDISGAQVDALADAFTQLLTENGGEVKKREYWGLRNLSYRMRKNRKGHYVLLNIAAPPAAIAELERTMRINEDVIRYLTIRVDTHDDAPSSSCRAAAAGMIVSGAVPATANGTAKVATERTERADRPERAVPEAVEA